MAAMKNEDNARLLTIAISICGAFFGIIVMMLSYWISVQHDVIEDTRAIQNRNGNRLTAIETRLGRIEADIKR